MPSLFVRIPEDRIGVLIGTGGATKRRLEEKTATRIEVDPAEGEVTVTSQVEG
jgi:ribosomal RNA assembly protein